MASPGDQASRHTFSEVGCSLIRCRVDAMPSTPHPVRWKWGRQSGRDRGLSANPSATGYCVRPGDRVGERVRGHLEDGGASGRAVA